MDILPSHGENAFNKVEAKVLFGQVLEVMDKVLDKREKLIICYRYGIGKPQLTQIQIAERLGISRSYVSRIEKKAIGKLSKEFC